MPQVPLPRAGLSTGATPSYTAPRGVVPMGDVAGQQAQQLGAALTKAGADVGKIAVRESTERATLAAEPEYNQWVERSVKALDAFENNQKKREIQYDVDPGYEAAIASKALVKAIEADAAAAKARLGSGFAGRLFSQAVGKRMGAMKSRAARFAGQASVGQLQRQSIIAAKAGQNQIGDFADKALTDYGDQLGRNAIEDGAAQKVIDGVEAERKAIEAGLPTEYARKLFHASSGQLLSIFKRKVYQHETNQTGVWEKGEDEAGLENASRDAVAASREDFPEAMVIVDTKALDMAAAQGLGKKATANYVRNVRAGVYGGVIDRLLQDGSVGALDYAKGLLKGLGKEDITPEAATRLGLLVDKAYDAAKVDAAVTQGLEIADRGSQPGKPRDKSIAAIARRIALKKRVVSKEDLNKSKPKGETAAKAEWLPGGDNYDLESAEAAGMKPDRDGHYGSRVPSGPQEGLILKSLDHPTFGKTVEAEAKAGMEWWYDIEDARYYTFPKKDVTPTTVQKAGTGQKVKISPKGGAPHRWERFSLGGQDMLQARLPGGIVNLVKRGPPSKSREEIAAIIATDPDVQAEVAEALTTGTLSSISEDARRPVDDAPILGSLAKAKAAILAMPGLTDEQRENAVSKLRAEHGKLVTERRNANAVLLMQVHEIFQKDPDMRGLDISPGSGEAAASWRAFEEKYPDLFRSLEANALEGDALGTALVGQQGPVHSGKHFHMLGQDIETGHIGRYSWGFFWSRYHRNLDPKIWLRAVAEWEKATGQRAPRARGDSTRAGGGGGAAESGMKVNPLVSYKRRIAGLLGPSGLNRLTGRTGGEDPRPKPADEEESAFMFALELALGERLDEVEREGGALKWEGPGGIEAFVRNFSNRKLTHRRGQDLGLTAPLVSGSVAAALATATKAIGIGAPGPLKVGAGVTAAAWVVVQTYSALTGGPTVFSSPWVEKEAWKVAEDLRQARARGDTEKVKQLTELLQSAYIEITPEHKAQTGAWEGLEVGDKVRADFDENTLASKRMLGVPGDDVPPYVSFYIRTQWRKELALRILPTRDAAALLKEVSEFFKGDPRLPLAAAKSLVSKDRLEVDLRFERHFENSANPGLADAWPPLDHQWMVWQEMKRRYPEDFPGVGTAQAERAFVRSGSLGTAAQRRVSAYRQLGSGGFSMGDYLGSRTGFQDVPRSIDEAAMEGSDSRGELPGGAAESINAEQLGVQPGAEHLWRIVEEGREHEVQERERTTTAFKKRADAATTAFKKRADAATKAVAEAVRPTDKEVEEAKEALARYLDRLVKESRK